MTAWIVSVVGGPAAGRRLAILGDGRTTVGRAPSCHVAIDDPDLAGEQCTVECVDGALMVATYPSAQGSLVNGVEAGERASLDHGDWLRIGGSDLLFYREGHTADQYLAFADRTDAQERALEHLHGIAPLFAVVDVARDTRLIQLLRETTAAVHCILDEPQATHLAYVAPYLVEIPAGDALLETLVTLGWGHSWGVWVQFNGRVEKLRRHLRNVVHAENPDTGAPAYFRFYNPRVLRQHLLSSSQGGCTPRARAALFGDVEMFCAESEAGDLLTWSPAP